MIGDEFDGKLRRGWRRNSDRGGDSQRSGTIPCRGMYSSMRRFSWCSRLGEGMAGAMAPRRSCEVTLGGGEEKGEKGGRAGGGGREGQG
jgi:hypothetical protein